MSPLQTYQGVDPVRFVPAAPRDASNGYAEAPKVWLSGPLETFSLCMASHGLCVSSAMMLDDKTYAIQQITCAQALGDDMLGDLALALSRQLKLQQ